MSYAEPSGHDDPPPAYSEADYPDEKHPSGVSDEEPPPGYEAKQPSSGPDEKQQSLPPGYADFLRLRSTTRSWFLPLGNGRVFCITPTEFDANSTVVLLDYSGSMYLNYQYNDQIARVALLANCTVLAFSTAVAELELTEQGGVTGTAGIRDGGTNFDVALTAAEAKLNPCRRDQRQLLFVTDGQASLSSKSRVFLDTCNTVTVVYFGGDVDKNMLRSCARGSGPVGQLPAGVLCENSPDGTLFSVQGSSGESLEVAVRQLLGRSVRSEVVEGESGAGLQTRTFVHKVSELSSSEALSLNATDLPPDERSAAVASVANHIRLAQYPPSVRWTHASALAKYCNEWFQNNQLFGADQLLAELRRVDTAKNAEALTRLLARLGTVANAFAVNNVPSRLAQKALAKRAAFAQQTLEHHKLALSIVEAGGGFPQGPWPALNFKEFATPLPESLALNPGSVTLALQWTPDTTAGFVVPLFPSDAAVQLAFVVLALIASTQGSVPYTAKLRLSSLCNALLYANPKVPLSQFVALAAVTRQSLRVDLPSQVLNLQNESGHPLCLTGLDGEHPAANSVAVSLLGTRSLEPKYQRAAVLALAWYRYGKLGGSRLLGYSARQKVSSFREALVTYLEKPLEVEVQYSIQVDTPGHVPLEQSGSNPPFPSQAQVERVLPLGELRWSDVETALVLVLGAHYEMGPTSQSALARTEVYRRLQDFSAKLVEGRLRFTVPSATATHVWRAFCDQDLPAEPLSVVLDLLAGVQEAYAAELVSRVWDKNPDVDQVVECCSRALALFLKYAPWEQASSAPLPWARALGAPPSLLTSLPSDKLYRLVQLTLHSKPQEAGVARSLLAVVRARPDCGSDLVVQYNLDESEFCHELVTNWPLGGAHRPKALPEQHSLSEEVWCLRTVHQLREVKEGGGEEKSGLEESVRTRVAEFLTRPAPARPKNVRLFKRLYPDLFEADVPLDVLQKLLLALGLNRLVGLNYQVQPEQFLWNQYDAEQRESTLRSYWTKPGGRVNQHDSGLGDQWFERALPTLRATTLKVSNLQKVRGNKPNGALVLEY